MSKSQISGRVTVPAEVTGKVSSADAIYVGDASLIVGLAEYEINVAEAAGSVVSRFEMVLAQFAVVVAAVPAVSTEV